METLLIISLFIPGCTALCALFYAVGKGNGYKEGFEKGFEKGAETGLKAMSDNLKSTLIKWGVPDNIIANLYKAMTDEVQTPENIKP